MTESIRKEKEKNWIYENEIKINMLNAIKRKGGQEEKLIIQKIYCVNIEGLLLFLMLSISIGMSVDNNKFISNEPNETLNQK